MRNKQIDDEHEYYLSVFYPEFLKMLKVSKTTKNVFMTNVHFKNKKLYYSPASVVDIDEFIKDNDWSKPLLEQYPNIVVSYYKGKQMICSLAEIEQWWNNFPLDFKEEILIALENGEVEEQK